MRNGCILNGGVGVGKSRTALYYYFKEQGGWINGSDYHPMTNPRDLYIITTARKRDTRDWEKEMLPFLMSSDPESSRYGSVHAVTVDSWNNIEKYRKAVGAFFIFDEQRVVGSGVWVKAFLDIARKNQWILLSATPGDCWSDYIPVFIANGFYKNKTDFKRQHIVYDPFVKRYPKIDHYENEEKLLYLKSLILIDMEYLRKTIPHHKTVITSYDTMLYRDTRRNLWDPFKDIPIEDSSGLYYVLRRIVNSDPSREKALMGILEKHPKVIVFYNFDYELEILRALFKDRTDISVGEWNGHKHELVPKSDKWVYLVQYTAGCEGWNCIETDTVVFYSQNYSYKVVEQACGRIDRLNTPFTDLYYYHLRSAASIDLMILQALKEKKIFNEARYKI